MWTDAACAGRTHGPAVSPRARPAATASTGVGQNVREFEQIRPLDELWALWEPHQSILRPILGLGRDGYVFAVYLTCPLFITHGVLISGYISLGVIINGIKFRCF